METNDKKRRLPVEQDEPMQDKEPIQTAMMQ